MKEAPPFVKQDNTKEAQSQEPGKCIKERFARDLNKILNEWPDLVLDVNRAKRVQERRDAKQKLDAKFQELQILVREGMKTPGTGIVVYEKLNRLFHQTMKHSPSVRYLVLSGIEEKVR